MGEIICTEPGCNTTAGCQCRKPFGVNFTWGHVKDLPSAKEVQELRADNARLRAELAEARAKALEEAATLIEQRNGEIPDRQEIAKAIRSLAGKEAG